MTDLSQERARPDTLQEQLSLKHMPNIENGLDDLSLPSPSPSPSLYKPVTEPTEIRRYRANLQRRFTFSSERTHFLA